MKRLVFATALLVAACGDDAGQSAPTDSGITDIRSERDAGTSRDSGTDAGEADADSPDMSSDFGSDMPAPDCVNDVDCSDGLFCNGVERCSQGRCYGSPTPQCSDPSSCTQDNCDEANQRCEFVPDDTLCAPGQQCRSKGGCFQPAACIADADCDDGLLCNGTERCNAGQCEPGDAVECGDGITCTLDACVEGTGECQSIADHARCLVTELCVPGVGCSPRPPCDRNDDCDDGLYCNGTETCVDSVCAPGTPPVAVDSVDCTIDQCDEALNTVINTPDNARCSDGVFCNGSEVCHPANGCGPGAPPVVSDGVGCTTDTCNEALKFIEHTPNDALCDDNLFCNGAEVCHPIDDCSPGEPPLVNDGVGCTTDTCSEVNDVVLHVPDDGLCNDGLYCNGEETCDPVNDCQPGATPVSDDGVSCTVDACDESNDVVVNTPDDSRCAPADMCSASETCDPTNDCVAGAPVNTDDMIACTIDACDPSTGTSHTPDDSLCDDGAFCNGVETCDATTGCAPGTSPADDQDPCTDDFCNEGTDTVSHAAAPTGTVCGSGPRSICMPGGCAVSRCNDGYIDTGAGETCEDGNTTNGDGCSSNCRIEVVSCDIDDVWVLGGQPVYYYCAPYGIAELELDVDTVTIGGNGSSGVAQPGYRFTYGSGNLASMAMSGSGQCPGSFTLQQQFSGSCTETYTLNGTFTDADNFTGTFTAQFNGSCDVCTTQTFNVTGTRQ